MAYSLSPPPFGKSMLDLRSKDDTVNVGTRWTIEEDNRLVQEIKENKTYEEIALEHKRTVYGIQCRVISHIIYPKIKETDSDMDLISLEYKIDDSLLLRQINKIKGKVNKKSKDNDDIPTNKQILEYLIMLDNKINEINSKLDNLEYLR
jgi:hypothetical protein